MAVAGFAQQGEPRGSGGGRPHGGAGHGGPRGGGFLGPLARDLNLTDAQKTQIKTITDSFEESTKSLREQLSGTGGGPLDGLTDGAFDETTVRAAAQARANVHVELEVARARMMSQVYALLTAEQKAKVAELRRQFEQKGRGAGHGF
jgi:Spy/CpxP family protein refolding chaperone